jgi:hypothetical protein
MAHVTDIHRTAQRNAFLHGAHRTETRVVVGLCGTLFVLSALNGLASPQFSVVWAILGLVGAGGVMAGGLRNKALVRACVHAELDQRANLTEMRTPELQASVARARRQHRSVTKMLGNRGENVQHVTEGLDDWAAITCQIAHSLDAILTDPQLIADCRAAARSLGQAISASGGDEATALARFAALVAHGAPESVNPAAYQLMLALHVAIQVRTELARSIERVTNIKTALQRARQHKLEQTHVQTIESVLSMQIGVLTDAQTAVKHLAKAYAAAR